MATTSSSSRRRSSARFAPLLGAVLAAALVLFGATPAQAAGSDPAPVSQLLANCVNHTVGAAQGTTVTKDVLASITSMNCDGTAGYPIDSLAGLQYATALQTLYITGDPTTNGSGSDGVLSYLSGLKNLGTLGASSFNVTDVSPLAKLTGLSNLFLSHNPLTDAREISSLVNLTALTLTYSYLTTAPDLTKLHSLTYLDLDNNYLTTPPKLTNLPNLTSYNVDNNSLTALPDTTGSPQIAHIYASNNRVTSLALLANDSALTILWVDHNAVVDLSPLSLLANLASLAATAEHYTLADARAEVATALPTMKDPQGTPIVVTVSPDSPVAGTVANGTITWHGVGTGILSFNQSAVFGSGNYTDPVGGTITQNSTFGTLTKATPTITGTTTVGQKITANPGAWGPAPVVFKYQWYRNGVAISGAVSSYHTLTTADGGSTITVAVTGSKPAYTPATVMSAATPTVLKLLTATPTPTISGTLTVGQIVTAAPGTWSPAPVALAYQWYRNGVAISGATTANHTLNANDAGTTLTVTVTGTKSGYASVSKTSAATAAIAKATLSTATPTISGTAKVGSVLTAKPGTWGPAPVTLAYQWYRNGAAISGATAATYTVTSADAAKSITVKVTGTKSGYTTAAKTSAAVTPTT